MRDGEVAPLMELCPPDSGFFSSPRLTGRGGGIASPFLDSFNCKQILVCDSYTSFELQLFTLNKPSVVMITVIYRHQSTMMALSQSLQISYLDLFCTMTGY